tara:strand:+ start:836 stop:1600 length:765 start_codon:yes stop_codon:yes gene_type:complete
MSGYLEVGQLISYKKTVKQLNYICKHFYNFFRFSIICQIVQCDNLYDITAAACYYEQIELLEYIYDTIKDFHINLTYIEQTFILDIICMYNKVKSLRWFLLKMRNIRPSLYYQLILNACHNNYLDIIKILYVENPLLADITQNNHKVFGLACLHNHQTIINWFAEMFPDIYQFDEINKKYKYQLEKKHVIKLDSQLKVTQEECGICYNNMSIILSSCNHQFCKSCFDELISKNKNTCPYCRQENFHHDCYWIST